ncbi:phosphatase PAP2 family protein, partial [Candidatus Woesearchaeota archaeon]|nr:phosphatase PAP2 family protein [Candidatus Woesearchaeota archaeon]
LGAIYTFILFAVILYLFGPKAFSLPFGIFVILSAIVAYPIKWLFPTPRPDHKEKPLPKKITLWNYWRVIDHGAFPSAHAMRTAGLATLSLFFSSRTLHVILLALFFIICWSRIHHRRHYPKDVIGGALMGIIIMVLSWYLAQCMH